MRISETDLRVAAAAYQVTVRRQGQQTGQAEQTTDRPDDGGRTGAQVAAREARARSADPPVQGRRALWANDPLLANYITVLQRMFGVKVEILDPNDLSANGASEVLVAQSERLAGASMRPSLAIHVSVPEPPPPDAPVDLQAAGTLTTADGRALDIELATQIDPALLAPGALPDSPTAGDAPAVDLGSLPPGTHEARVEFTIGHDGGLQEYRVLTNGTELKTWHRPKDEADDLPPLLGAPRPRGPGEEAWHGRVSADDVSAAYLPPAARERTVDPRVDLRA